MIVFLRSLDCNPDPRVQKYCDYLYANNINYRIVCWDRSCKLKNDHIHSYYQRKSKYGTGLKNAFGILGFNWYIFCYLLRNKKSYKVIHACDFDTILPAIILKLFFGKKVIYDIFDWFVDSRHFNNRLIKTIILTFERFFLKHSDITIICEEERTEQLNYIPHNLWVLPNIPTLFTSLNQNLPNKQNMSDKVILSYVGTMPADRGIDKLLECVKNNSSLELNIAGFGIMDKLVKEYSDCVSNIHYFGTVSYEKGLEIMANSDIIVALYEKTVLNNVYAAPNKYYEGLFLGKPILTTEGTLVGNKTEKGRTGFVIGESLRDLESFFICFDLQERIDLCSKNAREMWIDKYVVLGHVIGYNNCEDSFLWRFIYSFHMPLFMFISGYVAQMTFRIERFGWNETISFLIKKLRTLLLPMVTWGVVIPFFFLRTMIDQSFIDCVLNFVKTWGGGLWFFATLFILSILFFVYRWVDKQINAKSIFVDLVILLFLFILVILLYMLLYKDAIYSEGIRSVFNYFMFYFFRSIVCKQTNLRSLILNNKKFFTFSFVMFFLLIPSFVYDMSSMFNQLMKIVLSLFAIFSLFFIVHHISWNRQVDNMFQYFGRESLSIYVTHNGPFAFLLVITDYITLSSVDNIPCFLFLFIFSLFISYASIWIKNIVSISPILELFLYGKSYKRKSI